MPAWGACGSMWPRSLLNAAVRRAPAALRPPLVRDFAPKGPYRRIAPSDPGGSRGIVLRECPDA